MGCTRREFLALASMGAAAGLAGCTPSSQETPASSDDSTETAEAVDLTEFEGLAIDGSAWRYDEDNDVYYQLGLTYCNDPATTTYESLAVFVPGAYFTAEENGSTYTCTINEKAVVGGFTPATAPVLMPINTGTLAPQASPTAYSYDGLSPYLEAGCVYVYAGFRGRSAGYDTSSGTQDLFAGGSPWPAVDLKAAVRFLRYNDDALPCDTSRTFVFGFGAGGGLSAVLGSSGDSALFEPYLESIGAVTHDAEGNAVSDAIRGSASWCPVTSFDMADAAYEWSQGQYDETGTRAEDSWTHELSQDLARAYGAWVNEMDLRDDSDEQLTLDETEAGIYSMGSYATALLEKVDEAASYFVQNTTFPYTYTPQRLDEPSFPGDPNLLATREADAATQTLSGDAQADGTGTDEAGTDATTDETEDEQTTTGSTVTGVALVQSTIYDSAQNYFAALNEDYWWINYSHSSQSVSVSSLRDLSLHLCPAELSVSSYDATDRSSKFNQLFGIDEESTLHFDATVAALVEANVDAYGAYEDWDTSYETAWEEDLEKVDSLETDMATRVSMMNPLFWLSGHYEGYGQSSVAPHWRINAGLFDTDVSPCSSLNVVLALQKYDGVADVSYTPVWGQGHVLAERLGSATSNLLAWVLSCCTE